MPVVVEELADGFVTRVPVCADDGIARFDLFGSEDDDLSTRGDADEEPTARVIEVVVTSETIASDALNPSELHVIGRPDLAEVERVARVFVSTDLGFASWDRAALAASDDDLWLITGREDPAPLSEYEESELLEKWC